MGIPMGAHGDNALAFDTERKKASIAPVLFV